MYNTIKYQVQGGGDALKTTKLGSTLCSWGSIWFFPKFLIHVPGNIAGSGEQGANPNGILTEEI